MPVTEALKLLIEVDERGAVRGFDSVSTSLKSSTKAVDQFDKSLEKVSTGTTRVGKGLADTGKTFDGYRTRLSRVGDAADTLDTRFGGLSDGISGVSSLMEAGSLAPQQMALAFADLGSAASTTVIPSIKNLGRGLSGLKGLATGTGKVLDGDLVGGLARASKGAGGLGTGIGNLVAKLGGMRNILVGGGIVAGLTGLVAGLKAIEERRAHEEVERFFEALAKGEKVSTASTEKLLLMGAAWGGLGDSMKTAIETGGPAAGKALIQLAEDAGAPASVVATLKGEFHELQGTFSGTADEAARVDESITSMNDALRAQFDPVFAASKAQRALSEALANQSAVYKDSESSATDKARADQAVMAATVDLQGATNDLNRRVREGTLDVEKASAEFVDMATRMGIPKAEARRLADQIFGATQKSLELGRQRPTPVLRVQDLASGQIRAVQGLIRNFGGTTATATLRLAVIGLQEANRAAALRQSFQHGGVVKGPKGSPQLVVAHAGETVVPTHSRSEMSRFGSHLGTVGGGAVGGAAYTDQRTQHFHIQANDPHTVVEAIKKYERNNGPGWRR